MHIPDGVLAPTVAAATGIVGAGGLAISLWRAERELGDRAPLLMGMMAAFVFAAQMVNFPLIPLPISGHLLGGVLSAVVLGPWAGAAVIGSVLVVQSLAFADGGITALGANFVNMGLIGSVLGYAIYVAIRRAIGGRAGILVGGMAAAWFSVILGSGAFALELAPSTSPATFLDVLSWMALVHSVIGLGEAIITGLVLRFILQVRPDLIYDPKHDDNTSARNPWQAAIGGLALALALAVFLAPFASEHPDGLEWVGKRLGFLKPGDPLLASPMPDYQLKILAVRHIKAATAIAGLVGTFVVFGVGFGLARVFTHRPSRPISSETA